MSLARQRYSPRVSLHPDRKRTQVTLQEWTESDVDGHGQPTGSWGNLDSDAAVWAEVLPVSGRIAEYAHQLYSQATHRVMIDYRSDVTTRMRLKLGTSRYLYIGHVRDLEELGITLELLCVEGDMHGS